MTTEQLKKACDLNCEIDEFENLLKNSYGKYSVIDITIRGGDRKQTVSFNCNDDFAKNVIEVIKKRTQELNSDFDKL